VVSIDKVVSIDTIATVKRLRCWACAGHSYYDLNWTAIMFFNIPVFPYPLATARFSDEESIYWLKAVNCVGAKPLQEKKREVENITCPSICICECLVPPFFSLDTTFKYY